MFTRSTMALLLLLQVHNLAEEIEELGEEELDLRLKQIFGDPEHEQSTAGAEGKADRASGAGRINIVFPPAMLVFCLNNLLWYQ